MPIGAAIGALGSAYGASVSSSASSDAADKAAQTQMYALMMQKKIYDEQMARQQPFYEQGISSLEDYAKMLKGGYDMKQSPAAQYELEQGTKALNRQLAARGMSGGGIAARRLAELSGGVAARDWQNQYSRLVDSLKLGTGASASMGQSGQYYGNQIGHGASSLSDIYLQNARNQIGSAGLYSTAAQNLANQMSNSGATAASIGMRMGWGGSGSTSGNDLSGVTADSLNGVNPF
jgi:hypothetical protein